MIRCACRKRPYLPLWLILISIGCENDFSSEPEESDIQRPSVATQAKSSLSARDGHAAARDVPSVTRPDDWFEDVSERARIDFAYQNGREAGRFYFIEALGGGLAMLDFDLDGDVDLFFVGGGQFSKAPAPPRIDGRPCRLYRNDGGWNFVEVTLAAQLSEAPDYSNGCTVTDFDNDGFPDLFVCCYGRSRLYRNEGDGAFVEATDATRLPAQGLSVIAAWGDIDRDGLADLFLARYTNWSPETDVSCVNNLGIRDLCGPNQYDGTIGQFFHNRGDGSFGDWSQRVGLKGNSKGLGLVAGDFNGDGWIDFYLANDGTANQLYFGTPEGLEEVGISAGVATGETGLEEGSMGTAVGDVDGDGLPDLWVVNFVNEDNSLYRNLGGGLFKHSTVPMGLSGISRSRVRWGTSLTDFDGDGWLDIVVLNGGHSYVSDQATFEEAPQLFQNRAGRRFDEISDRGGSYFRRRHAGRGCAVGDLDDDGAPDVVAVHDNAPVGILRNRHVLSDYVSVRIRATHGARDAVGARVSLVGSGPHQQVQFVVSGAGYASCSDDRLIFRTTPTATTADMIVDWPGRGREWFRGLALRQTHTLVEGRGERYDCL